MGGLATVEEHSASRQIVVDGGDGNLGGLTTAGTNLFLFSHHRPRLPSLLLPPTPVEHPEEEN